MQETRVAPVHIDYSAGILIAEHVRRLLSSMGMEDARVTCDEQENRTIKISILVQDSGSILIGGQGSHLSALQHIVRCILRKHLDGDVYILVDVNGYRARRERSLIGLAEEAARKAQRTGMSVELEPMNAVDRRAVHTALASYKAIKTESAGEGALRRVIVRPIFL